MSKPSRVFVAAILLLFTWMVLSGWDTDPPKARAITAVIAGFMVLLAAGLVAPTRLRIVFRVIAGIVAAAYTWYFADQLVRLIGGEPQTLRLGAPSALMAGVGLLVFAVPAFIYAVSGTTTGWLDRLLTRANGSSSNDDAVI